jgi:hypothetical protein
MARRSPLSWERAEPGAGAVCSSCTLVVCGGWVDIQNPNPIYTNSVLRHPSECGVRESAGQDENPKTTLNNGYLGSRNDEERSEMRYVV